MSKIEDKLDLVLEKLDDAERQSAEILTIPTAAKLLSRSPGTLYKWCAARLIPHYIVNGSIYFNRSEILEFVHAHRVDTQAEELNNIKLKSKQHRRPSPPVNTSGVKR